MHTIKKHIHKIIISQKGKMYPYERMVLQYQNQTPNHQDGGESRHTVTMEMKEEDEDETHKDDEEKEKALGFQSG